MIFMERMVYFLVVDKGHKKVVDDYIKKHDLKVVKSNGMNLKNLLDDEFKVDNMYYTYFCKMTRMEFDEVTLLMDGKSTIF